MPRSKPHPLRDHLGDAKNLPGTYRFLGADGEVLYVGKSKQLRSRLLSYLRAGKQEKGFHVAKDATGIVWEYEPSEFAALLRELELIKRWRPRWNVQHKRDSRYSFLKITQGPAPRLLVVQAVTDDRAQYYGPFRGGRRVAEAVRELNDVLGLRDCAVGTAIHFADQADLFAYQAAPRCHRHELRLCLAPCAGLCAEAEYRQRVDLARAFLAGDADEPLRWLAARMEAAAARWDFEYAAVVRDRAARLERLRDEFSVLREALEGLTFLYHVPGVGGADRVYLVRRGTVRAAVEKPRTAAERRRLARLTEEHFGKPEPRSALVTRHQVDQILLLARWFRFNPEERKRTIPPPRVDATVRSA